MIRPMPICLGVSGKLGETIGDWRSPKHRRGAGPRIALVWAAAGAVPTCRSPEASAARTPGPVCVDRDGLQSSLRASPNPECSLDRGSGKNGPGPLRREKWEGRVGNEEQPLDTAIISTCGAEPRSHPASGRRRGSPSRSQRRRPSARSGRRCRSGHGRGHGSSARGASSARYARAS